MEEAAIHPGSIENAEGSTVRVGKDGLAAKLVYDFLEACRDFVQSLVPTDALERQGFPFSPWALGANSFHGEEHAAGGVNPTQKFRYLGAKKSSGTGWPGSPWILVALPSSTVTSTPQASGQS